MAVALQVPVTSVALAVPNIFTVAGSPITSSGTITVSLVSQSQNLIFAAPNGLSGAPSFRALVAADIPALAYVTSVALAAPPEFTVSGSPITASGTLTFSKANQNINLIYAGPASGSAAAPSFRSLVANDIPSTLNGTTFNGAVDIAGGLQLYTNTVSANYSLV